MPVKETSDLPSESGSLQQLTHAAGIVEKLPSQLCRQPVPLHDKRGAEASKDVFLFACEAGGAVRPILLRTDHIALIIICEPLFIIRQRRESVLKLLKIASLL
jgi:hypothetical protein